MPRKSTAKTTAVYRGQAVKQFNLQQYGTLRRGLSSLMRAQTVGAQTLRSATAETQQKYLAALNKWRSMGQAEKAAKARSENPVEDIFRQAMKSDYFTGEEKTIIATAGLKLKTMDREQAIQELLEGLNARDRKRSSDFYKAEYYLDEGDFDPLAASDDMLREVISSGFIDGYDKDTAERAKLEYIRRMTGGTTDDTGEIASMRAGYQEDILSLAASIVGTGVSAFLMD